MILTNIIRRILSSNNHMRKGEIDKNVVTRVRNRCLLHKFDIKVLSIANTLWMTMTCQIYEGFSIAGTSKHI